MVVIADYWHLYSDQENKCTLEKLKEVSESKLIAKDTELQETAIILDMVYRDQEKLFEKLTSGELGLAAALDKKAAIDRQLEEVSSIM